MSALGQRRLFSKQGGRAERSTLSALAALLSLTLLVALFSTWRPMADRWSALPFALLAWGGFVAALAAGALGRGARRGVAAALVAVWLALWVLSWSEGANDAVASVRRAALAFFAL